MRPTEPLGSVSLRHVVEDAIALMRDKKELTSDRKMLVLTDLESLFDDAWKGSELSHAGGLFVAPSDKSAFEAFSLFIRHIGDEAGGDWRKLLTSREAVKALQAGEMPESADVAITTALLERLLASLRKHTPGDLRREPREFKLSS